MSVKKSWYNLILENVLKNINVPLILRWDISFTRESQNEFQLSTIQIPDLHLIVELNCVMKLCRYFDVRLSPDMLTTYLKENISINIPLDWPKLFTY